MKLFNYFRTPLVERVEEAIKRVADCRADAEYHGFMADYFCNERIKIEPQNSAADATEYARLYCKEEEHSEKHLLAERKHKDALAKFNVLQGKPAT